MKEWCPDLPFSVLGATNAIALCHPSPMESNLLSLSSTNCSPPIALLSCSPSKTTPTARSTVPHFPTTAAGALDLLPPCSRLLPPASPSPREPAPHHYNCTPPPDDSPDPRCRRRSRETGAPPHPDVEHASKPVDSLPCPSPRSPPLPSPPLSPSPASPLPPPRPLLLSPHSPWMHNSRTSSAASSGQKPL